MQQAIRDNLQLHIEKVKVHAIHPGPKSSWPKGDNFHSLTNRKNLLASYYLDLVQGKVVYVPIFLLHTYKKCLIAEGAKAEETQLHLTDRV